MSRIEEHPENPKILVILIQTKLVRRRPKTSENVRFCQEKQKMHSSAVTLASLRRQVDALMRQCARQLAVHRLRPIADQIVELWNIAVANKQPKPSPIFCVRRVAEAGFRLQTYLALHIYIENCQRYGRFPDAGEVADKLFPPGSKVNLRAVLPGVY